MGGSREEGTKDRKKKEEGQPEGVRKEEKKPLPLSKAQSYLLLPLPMFHKPLHALLSSFPPYIAKFATPRTLNSASPRLLEG